MMKIEYQLNQENFKELNIYMALHDRKIQKKLLSFMISLTIAIGVIACLFFRLSLTAFVMTILGALLMIIFFPKFFWKTEMKRIDLLVEKTPLKFNKTQLEIDKNIEVRDGNRHFVIHFGQIEKMDFTQNNCMIFYHANEKTNTLLVPNSAFTDEQLQQFVTKLQKETDNAKR